MRGSRGAQASNERPTARLPRGVPATAAARWAELAEATGDGYAIVDEDDRVVAASAAFAQWLRHPVADLVGARLDAGVAELVAHRQTVDALLEGGACASVEIERPSRTGGPVRIRLTFIPRGGDRGGSAGTIVVATDVTQLRAAQRERRRAQERLTEVEEDLRARVAQELHDGPIQLLAALTLLLSVHDDDRADRTRLLRLHEAIGAANHELRGIVRELVDADDETPAERLLRWSAPLIAGTPIELEVDDRSTRRPTPSMIRAMFVFVHEVIDASMLWDTPRRLRATVDDDGDGHRLQITVPAAAADRIRHGDLAMRVDAAHQFARSLGGTLHQGMVAPDVRVVTVSLPASPLTSSAPTAPADGLTDGPAGNDELRDDGTIDRPLCDIVTDDDLEAIVRGQRIGLIETDARGRIASINDVSAQVLGCAPSDAVGRDLLAHLGSDDQRRSELLRLRVVAGEVIRVEWRSPDPTGKRRWADVVASPRFDAGGAFAGMLIVTIDKTQTFVARSLEEGVLRAVEERRRDADDQLAAQLRNGPLPLLDDVTARLREIVDDGAPATLVALRDALTESIDSLRGSLDRITRPDVADGDLERALRVATSPILSATTTQLVIEQSSSTQLSVELATAMVQIAREAVVNAIRHGAARHVIVRLTERDGSHVLEIVDDGVGVDPGRLAPAEGHFGVRAMRERCAQLGGDLQLEARPGGGTRVTASVPA